jgi:hypothetical protein|tara:strand:+ start:51 stop:881 length:831 start_codon:yes stop_codon:yes gene_type:complete
MKDPKKKFLQYVSDISKTGADITQSPSAWQNFKSDLNSVVKYPFQSLRSKIQTGNIPYNLSGAIESGNFKSQPMDTAFDMVNAPGAALDLVQKLTSGKTNNTDKLIAGASILPVGRAFKVAQSLKKNKVFKHFGNTEINEIKNITNITRSKAKLLDKANLKNAKFTPFSTDTPRAGMKVDFGDGLTQNYYKSSSLGNKKFTQGINKGKNTFDKWIAFEGKANLPNNKNWFVKDADFETGYGSKMNEYMMDNLDKHIDPKFAKAATDKVMKFKNKFK